MAMSRLQNKVYSVEEEKKYAKQAAIELCYGTTMPDILERIDNAKDSNEITRIMTYARLLYFGKMELRNAGTIKRS